MLAQFNKTDNDGKIRQNRIESSFISQYTVVDKAFKQPIIARFYQTKTGANVYCCLWVNACKHIHGVPQDIYVSGGGKAGGYGYHKGSAALEDAINDAGITLSESISGRGTSAMYEAFESMALALGYAAGEFGVIHAHA